MKCEVPDEQGAKEVGNNEPPFSRSTIRGGRQG